MKKFITMGCAIAVMALTVNVEAKDWETDFKKASATAKKSGKYMLLDFTGSDWCGWCIKLDDEVFSKSSFKSYARGNLVRVMLDFPRNKRMSKKLISQNAELAKKYGVSGYPTVLILSPDGDLVGKTGYKKGGPKKYVEHLTAMIDNHKAK